MFTPFLPKTGSHIGGPSHPILNALLNIAFATLATFAIFSAAACAIRLFI
jgi:hypothetical protein